MSIKVLTVDDSRTIRLIVAKELKPFDCIVLEADNGVVGLAVASREKPDVILLDYTMPVMDGLEVLTRLRADPELKATPVIMLTAEAGRDRVMQIAKLGVRDYLIKPFKGEMLVERVSRVVALRSKSETPVRPKRFDDAIRILVVDDKPAIATQIRTALSDTPWQITNVEQPSQALDHCKQPGADLVIASLTLPNDGAHTLFQGLRKQVLTAALPVLGMSVRTATDEQARAQQVGFAGIVAKPIEAEDLKTKVCKVLKLETAYKYFKHTDAGLVLMVPQELSRDVVAQISGRLQDELAGTVDAGGDKLIVDLSQVQTASLPPNRRIRLFKLHPWTDEIASGGFQRSIWSVWNLIFRIKQPGVPGVSCEILIRRFGLPIIELVLSTIQACADLSLKHAIFAPEAMKTQCRGYAEAQTWLFVDSLEGAVALVK